MTLRLLEMGVRVKRLHDPQGHFDEFNQDKLVRNGPLQPRYGSNTPYLVCLTLTNLENSRGARYLRSDEKDLGDGCEITSSLLLET